MSNKQSDLLVQFRAEERRNRDRLTVAKTTLLAALKRARVATVEIAYDGEGDNGQINEVVARSAKGRLAKPS